jgi:polypyrimidine tract-binding protein 1
MTPSRVIHARNLPSDCTENDLYVLATPFGSVVNVLLLKGKNQAFVQMSDIVYATALVEFYTVTPAMIRYEQVTLPDCAL